MVEQNDEKSTHGKARTFIHSVVSLTIALAAIAAAAWMGATQTPSLIRLYEDFDMAISPVLIPLARITPGQYWQIAGGLTVFLLIKECFMKDRMAAVLVNLYAAIVALLAFGLILAALIAPLVRLIASLQG